VKWFDESQMVTKDKYESCRKEIEEERSLMKVFYEYSCRIKDTLKANNY
jgi:hypothetical protein